MRLFDIFKTKASEAYSLHYSGLPDPVWSGRDYKNFAHEAYQMNVVAYQAINRIADAVAAIEWEVWRGETVLSAHPLLDLLRRPNPMQGGDEFFRAKAGYLMIAGNGYDERVIVGGQVKELWTLRPDRMKVLPGPNGIPKGYSYQVGQRKVEWEIDDLTGDGDIRHMKLFNPIDDWYGLSPVEAGAFAVDQHNESMKWMQALLQNSARPSGALVIGGDKTLTPDQFNRLKGEMEETYQGARNAGRPMLLEGGLDWKQMGLSPSDMAIIETKYSSARDIALAFGVPPMLLGIPGDNTYANYKEARLAFWEDTVIPLVGYIASEMNAWLGPIYKGVEMRPNMDKIEAIAEKRRDLWAMADASLDLTLDEVRELKGYPPIGAPLGDMLMAEVRGTQAATPEAKAMLGDLAYGKR